MARVKEYRRLPGRGRKARFFSGGRSWSRLFLGRDHVLSVESNGWTESYRRFYLADIQGLVVSKTHSARNWNIIFGALAALISGLLVLAFNEKGAQRDGGFYTGSWIMVGFVGFFLLLLLVNLLRGPSCRATIQTPVSREVLPSLRRVRTAEKTFALMKPAIEQAQGTFEDWPATLDQLAHSTPARIIPGRGRAGTHYLRHADYRGAQHRGTFTCALLAAGLSFSDLFFHQTGLVLGAMAAVAAMMVFMIMAVVRQQDHNTTPALRAVTWAGVPFGAIYFLGCYFVIVIFAVKNPKAANDYWFLMKQAMAVRNLQLTVDGFTGACTFLLGMLGFIFASGNPATPSAEGA